MKKMVNGELVDLTPEEEAEQLAAIAAWEARHIPTDSEKDQEEINNLMQQPGSFVRAIAEIQFRILKGIYPVDPDITPKQYKDLIERHMRTRP